MNGVEGSIERMGPLGSFPWHNQQKFALASATNVVVVLGGNQCLAGEQEVYDPVEGYMRQVSDVDGPWHVMAWDGEKMVVAEAEQPYVKGVDWLYLYTLSNGEWLRATDSHRVLTKTGKWIPIENTLPSLLWEAIWARTVWGRRGEPSVDPGYTAKVSLLQPLNPASPVSVTRAVVLDQAGEVWDFGVPDYGNYIAAGVVNHNSGKTTVGGGIISRLVRREGPIYRRLRKADDRPLRIWVSPQSFEKYSSNWERRLREEVFAGMKVTHRVDVTYKQSPTPVFSWDDAGAGGNQLWGKSQDQGFLAFESDKVDLIVFDEEPKDPRIYTSAVQRLATTNGVIVLTFTPLLGMSWTHARFYHPTARGEYKVADRVWRRGNDVTVIEMGMADNPESVAGGGVARIQRDPGMTEAEKNTRLHGHYGYAEGLIFPAFATLHATDPDNPYLLDGLPADRPYSWLLTCDPNKRHGGLLTAIDHEGNRYYVAEHYKEDQPDRLHAKDYHEMLNRFGLESEGNVLPSVGVYADPGGAGAQAIVNLSDYKIYAQAVKKDAGSVKASIELIRRTAWMDPTHHHPVTGTLGAPHVYFLRSLRSTWKVAGVEYHESRLMWELRQYRQKDNSPPDTPIKEIDDLTDCARYVELVRPFSPLVVDRSAQEARANLDKTSRRASEEFDALVKKGQKPKGRGIVW